MSNIGTMDTTESADGVSPADDEDFLAPPTPEDRDALAALNARAGELRGKIFGAARRRVEARTDLDGALTAWKVGRPRISRDSLIRDFLKNSAAERARQATGDADMPSAPTPGPSVIDKSCAWGAGGNANDFTRKQMRNGFRRGSLSAASKGARLPSNRT